MILRRADRICRGNVRCICWWLMMWMWTLIGHWRLQWACSAQGVMAMISFYSYCVFEVENDMTQFVSCSVFVMRSIHARWRHDIVAYGDDGWASDHTVSTDSSHVRDTIQWSQQQPFLFSELFLQNAGGKRPTLNNLVEVLLLIDQLSVATFCGGSRLTTSSSTHDHCLRSWIF